MKTSWFKQFFITHLIHVLHMNLHDMQSINRIRKQVAWDYCACQYATNPLSIRVIETSQNLFEV